MDSRVEVDGTGKDPTSSSTVDESQLEKSIIRRGLATAAEIEACKSQRKQLVAKENELSKSLLEIMVENKVLTRSQVTRLVQQVGEANRKFQIPGYQMIQKLGKGSMGIVFKAKQIERRPGGRDQNPARSPGAEQRIHQAIRAGGDDRRQALP